MKTDLQWETAAYAASILDVGANTLITAVENLPDAEFFYNFDGTLPAMVVHHLSGQLAWSIQITSGEADSRGEEFYRVAKGDVSLDDAVSKLPTRNEIQSAYVENGKRALQLLKNCSQDTWASAPEDQQVRSAFPSIAHVWTGTLWHTFWHIGELGSKVSYLQPRPELTHPTLFRGTF